MMRLKAGVAPFQVVSGPFAGRTYKPGVDYPAEQIPKKERWKFAAVKAAAKVSRAKKTETKTDEEASDK